MPVNSKSVGEIQQMLDDCENHLAVNVLRCHGTTGITAISSDMSQCSSFPTPSSPLTADELDPSSTMDVRSRRKVRSGLLHTDTASAIGQLEKSPTERVNASVPDVMSSRDSCSHLARSKENKQNFLDKAVNALRKPFLRSKQSRTTRDARSKSAFIYVGNPNRIVDDFAINGTGQNFMAAVGSQWPESDAHQERSLSRQKPNDAEHGTWPKCRTHAAQRPSVLPLCAINPFSSTEDEGPSPPKPIHHGTDIRRGESARRHRPQISDSVVDYASQVVSQKSSLGTEDVPQSLAHYKSSSTAESVTPLVTPLGPHYAKRIPDQSDETTVTVRSRMPAEHHVTVISHFPTQHCISEMISYGDQAKYTQRPIPCTSPFSSAEKQLLNTSGVIMSSLPSRPEQPSLSRYMLF